MAPQTETTPEWLSSSQRFTALPTEDEPNSTTNSPFTSASTSAGNNSSSAGHSGREQTLAPGGISPLSDNGTLPGQSNAVAPYAYYNPSITFNNGINSAQQQLPNQPPNSLQSVLPQNGVGTTKGNPDMSPTSTAAAASAFNLDPSILQTTIGSLLQSPAAAQMFLNSLSASAQGQALASGGQTPLKSHQPINQSSANVKYPQNQSYVNTQPNIQQNGVGDYQSGINGYNASHVDPALALYEPLLNQNQLIENQNNLMRSYRAAEGINGDVDKLQESIDSLVRSMGLDLPGASQNAGGLGMGTGEGVDGVTPDGLDLGGYGMGTGTDLNGGLGDDFNVDEFLESLKAGTELAGAEVDGLSGNGNAGAGGL